MRIFFILILLTSCATVQEQIRFYVDNDVENTNWEITQTYDPFNGNSTRSIVYSSLGGGNYRVFTDQNGINYINYNSGDSYVCADSFLTVQHLFSKDGMELREDIVYGISSNNKTLVNKISFSLNSLNDLVRKLNEYDTMILRTVDTCGTQITNMFDISGNTHLQEIIE